MGEEINAGRAFATMDWVVIEAFDADVVLIIFRSEIWRPEKAEHGSREILKRLAGYEGSLCRGVGGSECHPQIIYRHRSGAGVQVKKGKPEDVGQRLKRSVGQSWKRGFNELEADELKLVSQTLEAGDGSLGGFG